MRQEGGASAACTTATTTGSTGTTPTTAPATGSGCTAGGSGDADRRSDLRAEVARPGERGTAAGRRVLRSRRIDDSRRREGPVAAQRRLDEALGEHRDHGRRPLRRAGKL